MSYLRYDDDLALVANTEHGLSDLTIKPTSLNPPQSNMT